MRIQTQFCRDFFFGAKSAPWAPSGAQEGAGRIRRFAAIGAKRLIRSGALLAPAGARGGADFAPGKIPAKLGLNPQHGFLSLISRVRTRDRARFAQNLMEIPNREKKISMPKNFACKIEFESSLGGASG